MLYYQMSTCLWNAQGELICRDNDKQPLVEHYGDVLANRRLHNTSEARAICPSRCKNHGGWNGNWLGGQQRGQNKCGCKN